MTAWRSLKTHLVGKEEISDIHFCHHLFYVPCNNPHHTCIRVLAFLWSKVQVWGEDSFQELSLLESSPHISFLLFSIYFFCLPYLWTHFASGVINSIMSIAASSGKMISSIKTAPIPYDISLHFWAQRRLPES